MAKIFLRKSENENESSNIPFKEVWNSETSQELPWKTLQKIEIRKRNKKHNLKIDNYGDDFRPHGTFESYEYYVGFEDPTEMAENIYGIPDPRLVEDW